ncbi:MAG: hypothetical protein FWB74_01225 [Defluviitaleaceae bacterium]|nr:hypothetical protein [Defluviitaleaceae bacterium]
MKKTKQNCHVCHFTTKSGKGEEPATHCEQCNADLTNADSEVQKLYVVADKGAGAVSGDLVNVFISNLRLIFVGEKAGGAAGLSAALLKVQSKGLGLETRLGLRLLPVWTLRT